MLVGACGRRDGLRQAGLNPLSITDLIITHFHPDHVGAAGWLCRRFGVRLWMNRTEWLMARMLTADVREQPPEEAIDQMRMAGWDDKRLDEIGNPPVRVETFGK